MVFATLWICFLSFTVFLHHFFTMGAGADVNAFFGIMSSIIAVPTGVKVFNWLFTMFRGRIVYRTPMLFAIGFIVTFVIGGMTGVLLAVPPVDFVLHNSTFLVAHFHNVIIGGVVFGAFAGYNYWFPKVFGFTLDERWGKAGFWCWLVGFYLAFMPLYVLGLHGMTRRLQHISDPSWQPWLLVAEAGAIVIMCGIFCQVAQLYVSIRTRERRRDLTGDPWNGRTLEWATTSPPPAYNFAVLPQVETIDAYWEMKRRGLTPTQPIYETLEMRPGADPYRRRLRLLDFHPQRHRHVFGAVRGLRGALGQYRRRTERPRAVQPAQCLHRNTVPAVLELHMRARDALGRAAPGRALLDLCRADLRARRGLPPHRDIGIRRHGEPRRGSVAQRFSVQLLQPGRHAWRPRHRRPRLACLYGWTGPCQRLASRRAPSFGVLQPVLARAGYCLDRRHDAGLPDGSPVMDGSARLFGDRSPGVGQQESTANFLSYTVGLGLAILATIGSFVVSQTDLLWAPGIPVGLVVLAFAQIGVHLVFFLHLGSGPDNTNNILALAFGVFIVFLLIGGSCWIIEIGRA